MRHYCYLFLFLLSVDTNIAENVKSSNHINRLLTLQTKLQKLQDNVSSATTALRTGDNNALIAFEPSVIEGDFQFLKKQLDNIIQSPASGSLGDFQSNPKTTSKDPLPSGIIADIRKRRFESAEEKLKQINNLEEISEIIQAVYERDAKNFDILANFIESLSDINLIYVSVNALLQQMVENDQRNPFKCIRLAKVLETRFINYPEIEYFTTQFRQFTYKTLKESITDFLLDALNDALRKGDLDGDGELDKLTSAVYLYDPVQWESIIYEFVNSNIERVSVVLDTIASHRLIEQRVTGVNILYWSLQFKHNPKSDVIIKIASLLKELRSDEGFENLKPSLKDLIDKIIENLPTCARNLFFLPTACLWNQGAGAYLLAVNSSSKYDSKRRQIFSTDYLPGSRWYFRKTENNYFVISSETYENELLCAAKTKHSPNLRQVFNRISKSQTKIEARSKWQIELDNDFCYLKSAKYNEYLITSNLYFGNNLRYVFTWVPKTFSGEPQFQWQIRDCI